MAASVLTTQVRSGTGEPAHASTTQRGSPSLSAGRMARGVDRRTLLVPPSTRSARICAGRRRTTENNLHTRPRGVLNKAESGHQVVLTWLPALPIRQGATCAGRLYRRRSGVPLACGMAPYGGWTVAVGIYQTLSTPGGGCRLSAATGLVRRRLAQVGGSQGTRADAIRRSW